ncbi:MAG: hypothetical protein Q9220_005376 [cf. Caloplaca sp. 1 TL-2023]
MSIASGNVKLPDYILDGWRFQEHDPEAGKDDFKDCTASALCCDFLRVRLAKHKQKTQTPCSVPSLVSSAIGTLLKVLESSHDTSADISYIVRNIDSTTLRHLLQDARIPYPNFRQVHALVTTEDDAIDPVDIDEAILSRERFMHTKDRRFLPDYLVTLKQLEGILRPNYKDGYAEIIRKPSSKGFFEMLDAKRKDCVQFQPSDDAFASTFDEVTHGILQGLNWENVFVAGGMVLNTLLHAGDIDDNGWKDIKECDVDLYLYGLDATEANAKVEEIYQVWLSRNEAYCLNYGVSQQHVVIKTRNTINFIPEYPGRRLQVVLKLQASPLDILLNFDLDACALGWDGSRVLMLPRCARAIETGYSVFTMDLVWGHYLAQRRETQESRIFKYADRGFGLRILPSYIDSLGESGLETLTSIADAAKDSVFKFFFERQGLLDHPPPARLSEMDGPRNSVDKPNGRNGIGIFQVLLRHAAIWQMDAVGLLRLDRSALTGLAYDQRRSYDGLPTYEWGPNANARLYRFQNDVDQYNYTLFDKLKLVVANKLGLGPRREGYMHYLTRRIRHIIVAGDLASMQRRQITTPVVIPSALETFITNELGAEQEENVKQALSGLVMQAHDSSRWHPSSTQQLPPLHDTTDESGNLRYWLGTNTSMWSGQHWLLDEVAEILDSLYGWFLDFEHYPDESDTVKHGTDNSNCAWHIGRDLRRRLALPDELDEVKPRQGISPREARLFQAWALAELPETRR